MKKVFFTAIISLLAFSGYSQVNPPASKIDHQYKKDQFLIKAKKQKTAAWVCLGGGVVLFTTGVLIAAPKVSEDMFRFTWSWGMPVEQAEQHNYTGESILMIVGLAGVITSIPLFAASKHNKRNARLLVTSQKASFISAQAVSKNVTGLTFSLAF